MKLGYKSLQYIKFLTKTAKGNVRIFNYFKNYHYGPISQKMAYRIFSNIPFWKAPEVPNNIHTGVYQTHEVWKTRPRKGVWELFSGSVTDI